MKNKKGTIFPHKKIRGIFITLVILYSLISACSNGVSLKKSKIFIGYYKDDAVFDSFEDKKLFIFKNGKLSIYKEYNTNYWARYIYDSLIYFEEDVKDGTNLILSIDGSENKYFIKNKTGNLCVTNDGTIYFTNDSSYNILLIKNNINYDTKIKGNLINVIDNVLFYSTIHDENDVGANADIYKINLKQEGEPIKIIENIAGEITYILPDQKFIFDEKLIDGIFKPVLFDLQKNKCVVLQIDNKMNNTKPFYLKKEHSLVFYNPYSFEMQMIYIK